MNHTHLYKEFKEVSSKIDELKKALRHLPEGELTIECNGKWRRWYYLGEKGGRPLSKRRDRKLAEDLALRRYYESQMTALNNEQALLQKCIEDQKAANADMIGLFGESTEYNALVGSRLSDFGDVSEEVREWLDEDYEKSEIYPEMKKFKVKNGFYVRSKSEVIWATILLENKIPFRYEQVLKMGEMTYYPDFTLLHPETLRTYYVEHLGMIDKPAYFFKNIQKIENYVMHGIVPTDRLILTYETEDCPLDPEYVQGLINIYFK